jgi:DNA polymerase-3 subunit epsilon/CBS domain-containing protein
MSLADWQANIRRWISRVRPEDILSTDIFFDAVPVHGASKLGEGIRDEALALAAQARNFLTHMAVNAADFDLPLGWFGRFKLDDGRMDLKKGGIMPVFSAARVLAIKHGVAARSTPERLTLVRGKEDAHPTLIDNLIEAHKVLLGAILRQQLIDLEHGVPPSNEVAPASLSSGERDRVHWALEQVRTVPNILGDPIVHR